MKRKMTAGSTSQAIPIFVGDTSSTTGAGLSGLTSATSGLLLEYRRQNQSAWTTVGLSNGTLGTWSSGGLVADGALAGAYELGLPDAALASAAGVTWCVVRLRGATNMLPVLVEVELDAIGYQDGVRAGLSALPAVASGSAGAILTSGIGTAQLNVAAGKVAGVVLVDTLTTYTGNTPQTGDAFARIGVAGAGLTAVVIAAAGLDAVQTESGVNLRQAADLFLAALAGVMTGPAPGTSGTVVAKNPAGTVARITAAVDTNGYRTSSTLNPPA